MFAEELQNFGEDHAPLRRVAEGGARSRSMAGRAGGAGKSA
jgi:hypothetical protein